MEAQDGDGDAGADELEQRFLEVLAVRRRDDDATASDADADEMPDLDAESTIEAARSTDLLRDTDDEVFRAAEELGIDLSHAEPSSVEEV